jgi:DNA mismatch repair protein MutS
MSVEIGGPKITPMFAQYLGMKEEYPDSLLFFRMGDFYELFFEDAEIAARELQIALTCRNPNQEVRVPMCGVPHHAVEHYLGQLLEKGYKVAICDQIEDPRQAKGLVKRAVTRVMTPGTIVEDSGLSAKAHNYLAAVGWNVDRGHGALAFADVSTGEWTGFETRDAALLWQWLAKIEPREVLLPEGLAVPHQVTLSARQNRLPARAYFDPKGGAEALLAAQGVASLEVLDLADKPELVGALGAILAYLRQTQKQAVSHLGAFTPLHLGQVMILDEVTERNLELFRTLDGRTGKGTLLSVVDRTQTAMGGRLLELRLRQPWRALAPILANQAAVVFFHEADELRARLREHLARVSDLERLSTRIVLNRASPRDFVAVRQSLALLPEVRACLETAGEGELPGEVRELLSGWDDLSEAAALLEKALVDSPPPAVTDGGLFKAGFDPALDELLDLSEHGEQKMQELFEADRARHSLPRLKLGYNRVFGYYYELSRAAGNEVPGTFVRRQTLANAERYVTPELKELEDRLLSASDRRKSVEYALFQALRETIAGYRPRLAVAAANLARLDYWQGLAEAARLSDWTRPELTEDLAVRIRAGRHPVVEAVQGGANFIPNDVTIGDDARLLLITGPNMAGKSTVLRQVALIAILAQIGSFVPARSARLGLSDRIFSRVGASDNLAQGRSTFMVEMMETARILRQATRRSLVILDEIGRGTSTFDGLALAWAVVEDLSRRAGGAVRTLFATHYHELTGLEGRIPGVRNFNIAVREFKGDIIFLRRLVPGPADKSYGIEVAKLAGVPRGVVERAREILAELERARAGGPGASRAVAARQTLLPGLAPERSEPPETGEHPLVAELRSLALDKLTPLAALTLLHDWKERLDSEDTP